jgi:hypothetical protein
MRYPIQTVQFHCKKNKIKSYLVKVLKKGCASDILFLPRVFFIMVCELFYISAILERKDYTVE